MEKKYLENPEKQRAKTAKWRDENADLAKATGDAYRKENRESLNEKRRLRRIENIESERQRDKLYAANNRAKVRAKNARRRATEKQATPTWLTAIQKAQIQEFYEVASARQTQTGIEQHVDHIVPLKGVGVRGLHVPWNLQVLTEEENARKYNKLVSVVS
jgi:5-methylcytosine-specific restriction endonuclease McrA